MNNAKVLKQNTITLKEYIDVNYIPFQKAIKSDRNFRDIMGKLKIITNYDFVEKAMCEITENDIIAFSNLLKKDRKITPSYSKPLQVLSKPYF